ncbi:UNVERIFIED_CONTAM: hypothetical protein FKN15_013289 [Acipenser sinensis]
MQAMARATYCDARATLDLYRKPEEKRVPLKSWGNICQVPKDRRQQPDEEEEEEMKIRRKPETERRKQRRRLGICGGIDDVTAESVENLKICRSPAEKREPLKSWGNICQVPKDRRQQPDEEEEEEMKIRRKPETERRKRKQSSCAFKSSELPRGFTDYMRAILVDWLIQVHESFRCTEETLYLCVHLLNSSMRLSKVNIPTFQLLGMTCLFVACKKEECLFPESTELCFLMENCFTRKQLLRMERKVLTCLKFDLSYSQPLHFLYIVHTVSQCSQQVLHLAKYFLELTLMNIECIVCEPAQLAAAALCLARRVLQERRSPGAEEAWTRAVSLYSVSESVLCRIMRCMARAALCAENSETRATFMKYSVPERMEVSINSTVLCSRYLLDSTSEWIQFFKDAGIPAGLAVHYAVSFVDNRIQKNMLMDLSKEFMMDLGITVIGDIIAILKHAKVVYRQGVLYSEEKQYILNPFMKENIDLTLINLLPKSEAETRNFTSTSEWIQFFKDAGIPAGLAVHYAVSFVDNRIQKNMLMDLSKEFMMDLGITVIGDIIAILKHAKVVYRQRNGAYELYTKLLCGQMKTGERDGLIQFFKDAGIPAGLAVHYAVSFVDNRIQKNMLMDLSKEFMMDLGITVIE